MNRPEDASADVFREAEVPPRLAGERADRAAADLLPEFSRAQLTRWLRDGALTFDDLPLLPKSRLRGGERLRLNARREIGDALEAQVVPFQVVFEDDDLLVLDKPAGVVVHPGAGNRDGTLVNGLLAYRPALAALPRAGLIHRLDKGTTGLLIAAGHERALKVLSDALARREVTREYLAIVEGAMTGGREIEVSIGRDPRDRRRQKVRDDGRYALTRVRLQERFRRHTLVKAQLATGRTHQIRVHLSSIGHPLVGDRIYGSRGVLPRAASPELIDALRGFGRPALHAHHLAFAHPADGRPVELSVDPPADFVALVAHLRRDRETTA